MLDQQPANHERPPAAVRKLDLEQEAFPAGLRDDLVVHQDPAFPLLGAFRAAIPAPRAALEAPVAVHNLPPPPPLPGRMDAGQYDGTFMGADGKMYPATEDLTRIPAVYPWFGATRAGDP